VEHNPVLCRTGEMNAIVGIIAGESTGEAALAADDPETDGGGVRPLK